MLRALDTLDDRLAGPLARRPEPLLVLVALLFLAATGLHFLRFDAQPGAAEPVEDPTVAVGPAPEDPRVVLPDGTLRVGPSRGEALDAYTVVRARTLADRAGDHPDEQVLAVVSFDRYLTPGEVEDVLAGTAVRILAVRWQLRADEDDPTTQSPAPRGRMYAQGNLQAVLAPVWEAEAAALRQEAEDLEEMASTTTDEDFTHLFVQDAEQLRAAAQAPGGGCRCLYAAEVQGPLAELAILLGADEVRLVDPAPTGTGSEVVFLALIPEERGEAGESRSAN